MGDQRAHPWQQIEISLTAEEPILDPYTGVQVWAEFTCAGQRLSRPGFWDADRTWRIRFAAPSAGRWEWSSSANVDDPGLRQQGSLTCTPHASSTGDRFLDHGFWRIGPDARTAIHTDGTSAFLACDTAWALPWRATLDEVEEYAAFRSAQGFNAALLMAIQPDRDARGPSDRSADGGFAVGFRDLAEGRLRDLDPSYFQHLDAALEILLRHGIVPVLQPVFQGFGWKGLRAAGGDVSIEDYARFCRYLVARYGARPVVYLVGADGTGREPQVAAGGAELRRCDAYRQLTGLHYAPHATPDAHQDADWLDFQWCQTGHAGEHLPERVALMSAQRPAKAVANGEPTYENTGQRGVGEGWWQGHEAWSNLCAGGTMAACYGAASLWQWRHRPDEPGHADFYLCPDAGWREALRFPGARFVGIMAEILRGFPLTGMVPDWTTAVAARGVRGKDWRLIYRADGGPLQVVDPETPRHVTVVDPTIGSQLESATIDSFPWWHHAAVGSPLVYLFTDEEWASR